MKICFFILLLTLPALTWSGEDMTPHPDDESGATEAGAGAAQQADDPSVTWMDDSHAYATDQAQALTEWMDSFFGDPVYDIERPESLIRLEWANTWDEEDDHKSRVRLRGKIRLPRLSERLNLVFSSDEGDRIPVDGRDTDGDTAGLLYNVRERKRSRLDLTLGVNSDGLKPGGRFRYQGPITDRWRYRFTQRLQWEDDEGFFTTGQFNLDHAPSANRLIRWSSRARYGEETDGTEWRSGISVNHRFESKLNNDPFVLSVFTSVHGVTDPSYVENVRLGWVFRRQLFRRYFFVEVEPSYNFRKREEDEDRDGIWNIVLRFEILFESLRRRTPETVARERDAKPDYTATAADSSL